MYGALIRSVPPSGAARATDSVPMIVPAPGRFSVTIATPCARPTCSASSRATMSPAPPGGSGTTILMLCVACAAA